MFFYVYLLTLGYSTIVTITLDMEVECLALLIWSLVGGLGVGLYEPTKWMFTNLISQELFTGATIVDRSITVEEIVLHNILCSRLRLVLCFSDL